VTGSPLTLHRVGYHALPRSGRRRVFRVEVASGDEVFRAVVLARIIEPASKLDSLRVFEEARVGSVSNGTLTRRLSRYGNPLWRKDISAACAADMALGPASLVFYDVSTLYFETDQGDGSASRGFPRNAAWSRRSPLGR
jgi:hypothetical protein